MAGGQPAGTTTRARPTAGARACQSVRGLGVGAWGPLGMLYPSAQVALVRMDRAHTRGNPATDGLETRIMGATAARLAWNTRSSCWAQRRVHAKVRNHGRSSSSHSSSRRSLEKTRNSPLDEAAPPTPLDFLDLDCENTTKTTQAAAAHRRVPAVPFEHVRAAMVLGGPQLALKKQKVRAESRAPGGQS